MEVKRDNLGEDVIVRLYIKKYHKLTGLRNIGFFFFICLGVWKVQVKDRAVSVSGLHIESSVGHSWDIQ